MVDDVMASVFKRHRKTRQTEARLKMSNVVATTNDATTNATCVTFGVTGGKQPQFSLSRFSQLSLGEVGTQILSTADTHHSGENRQNRLGGNYVETVILTITDVRPKSLERSAGATGIEPVAPTMSGSARATYLIDFKPLSSSFGRSGPAGFPAILDPLWKARGEGRAAPGVLA
jgi:hypothetical protein